MGSRLLPLSPDIELKFIIKQWYIIPITHDIIIFNQGNHFFALLPNRILVFRSLLPIGTFSQLLYAPMPICAIMVPPVH
ncbi:hypothetical protein CDQ84_11110 [Clostridium thermosuccinogenes]|uniref:Uncharacterized protein n=1 Tax=Clostridium thermosuccinogenes TaxID=84032 RepID=A0A2K2FD51_9CLOT|nr:hypothetical protein CDO33_11945 [Pseudoclostridium thermosuccinogenes]PNT96697.1 hypothetical protein CDQ85_10955 [Pseudoclostridium thermosuccinogenes]PNT98491.1 hypothetical protein CDQ84_11110 [Pseudoclostridium thermosuccinogenes]